MNISGKLTLFIQEKKTKEGKVFHTYSTTIGNKQEDGSYLNASMDVLFDKNNFSGEKLSKLDPKRAYNLEVSEAWLTTRSFKSKEDKDVRVICIFIKEATVKDSKVINKSTEEVPF